MDLISENIDDDTNVTLKNYEKRKRNKNNNIFNKDSKSFDVRRNDKKTNFPKRAQ